MSDGAKESMELLPCPFCGADAQLHELGDGVCTIACTQCGIAAMQSPTKSDAVWCWNQRSAAPAQSNGDEGDEIEAIAGILCAADGNGFLIDCPISRRRAYEIRARDIAAYYGNLRSQLSTAEATYLQFCKKHDEEKAGIRSETIELCAKIAENNGWEATAAQIRDLKEIT